MIPNLRIKKISFDHVALKKFRLKSYIGLKANPIRVTHSKALVREERRLGHF